MVTYEPNLGIYFRTTKLKTQYHVQYFGISATRGWTVKSCVPFSDAAERKFDVKGLPKKVRAEYEVAMQEVNEAKTLSYNQRKLKFIFSFGPPRKGGKKNKASISIGESSVVTPIKVEAKEEGEVSMSLPEEVKQEQKPVSSSKRRTSKRMSASSRGCSPDLALASKHLRSTPQQQASSSTNEPSMCRPSSLHDACDKKVAEGGKKPGPLTQPAHDTRLNDKQRKESIEIPSSPPPCLHDQHSKRSPGMRRWSSDSSFRECEKCMEYICSSDSQPLKCISEPEKLKSFDMEASSKPIFMYKQNEYSSGKKGGKSSAVHPKVVSLLPSHVPLSKGVPTKNVVTEISSSAQESSRSSVSAHQSGGASRASRQPRSTRKTSSLSSASLKHLCSSTSSLSSESGHEADRNSQSVSTSGLLSGMSESTKDLSSSSLVASSLPEVQSKKLSETESENEPVRRSKRGRASSLSVSCSNGITTKEVKSPTEISVLPIAKRMHRVNRRHSEQGTSSMNMLAGRCLRVKDLATSDSISLSAESAVTSANESCSEASLTPMVLTPTASSSAESSSIGVDVSVVSDAVTSCSSASTKVKKKVKQNSLLTGEASNTCSICECEDTDLLMCRGYCSSLFHLDCLGLVEKPSFDFVCDECLISSGTCFVCGKAYGDVRQCGKAKCSKLYHLECMKDNKLFQHGKTSFTCPLHVCAKCTSIGGLSSCNTQSKNLMQCIKCPLALHQPDCLVAGCEILDDTHMVCYQHVKITRNSRLYSHINLNTCLDCGSIGSLYCCDVCSAAYHLDCLDEASRPASESSLWKCPSCTVHDLPTYRSLVITKFGKWRYRVCVCYCCL